MQPTYDSIIVLFFGRAADIMKTRRLDFALSGAGLTLYDLRDQVFSGHLPLANSLRMSVNQSVVSADQALHAGDEVAFFSVFSGG